MRSILPTASRFLNSGGVFGFAMSHGSVRITRPAGVVILNADCPNHWICTFPLSAPACPPTQANANAIAAKSLIALPSLPAKRPYRCDRRAVQKAPPDAMAPSGTELAGLPFPLPTGTIPDLGEDHESAPV